MATQWAWATRTGLGLVLLLGLMGGTSPGCSGAGATVTQGPLELAAEVGLGGVVRPGLPFPIELQVSNRGSEVDAELRVLTRRARLDQPWSQVDERRLPVRLPAGARFTWNLTLSVDDLVHPLVVELWPRGPSGAEPLRLETALRSRAARERVVAVVSRRGLQLPEEAQPSFYQSAQVVELRRPESLPHQWDGWLAADWVIVDDVPLNSLAAPQLDALRLWVAAGGRLLVLPRAALAVPAHAADLVPVTPLGRTLSLQQAHTELGGISEGTTLYLSLPGSQAETLHSLAGVPLAVRAPLGLGTTGWIGFDLSDPLLSPNLQKGLLEASLGGPARTPPPDPGSGSPLTWRSLRSVPILPPSPMPLAGMLTVHALVAFLLVRWIRPRPRRLLAGVGVLAAVASLWVGLSPIEAPGRAAAAVQVLEVSGGWGRGWGAWVLGQATPSSVRLASGPASWQVGVLDEERPEARTLLTVEKDLGSYLWDGPGYLPVTVRWPFQLDLSLTPTGDGTWRVENGSGVHLAMVLFYDGENVLPLPDLPPGASVEVDPRDPFLRLGRIGVRPGGLAELRRWTISQLEPGELTQPRTPLVTRAVEEGWERLSRQPEPLPVVMALMEPSPTPDAAPPSGRGPVASVVLLRPSPAPGGGAS